MIISFSGTGNSNYAAKQIANVTGQDMIRLADFLKKDRTTGIPASKDLVLVTPTYAWRIPRIVEQWLQRADLPETERAWFVMTCGGEIGNAAKYNRKLCEQKHWEYMGTMQILMPENYIAMFGAPTPNEANQIIAKAEPDMQRAGQLIRDGQLFPAPRNSLYDRLMSSLVNPIFYPLFVKSNAFIAKERCIGCGLCVQLCPTNNISLQDGKPKWGTTCTHCMACICHCPEKAIEYGSKSTGKPRYYCDENGKAYG